MANHAYMLTGYNSGTGLFEIYNPHGSVDAGTTRLYLTWDEVAANFSQSD